MNLNQGAQSCSQRKMWLERSDSHQAVWVQAEGEGLLSSHMGWLSGYPSVINASLSETSTPRKLPSGLGRRESAWEGIMTSCTWPRKGSKAPDDGQVQNLQVPWTKTIKDSDMRKSIQSLYLGEIDPFKSCGALRMQIINVITWSNDCMHLCPFAPEYVGRRKLWMLMVFYFQIFRDR